MINNRTYIGLIILFTLVYIKGLFITIYGIDATTYASISKEMMETGNWLQIFHKGKDYLDKPPLHFWLTASSFKLFGVSNFAYKLPSFIFTILGVFSTYKLGKLLYTKEVGKLASLLFYSCLAIIIINQDVRTDTILVGIVVFSIWQLIEYIETNKYSNLFLAFFGIGLAMLTKGPIGLMVPVLALGSHFLIKKEWKKIFKWQWIIGFIITGVVISPMLWGLYQQFDLQPTKQFNLASGMDGTGTSGLKFYFWDQSFGRITGGNKEWNNHSSKLFFTHTYLWSFLPWSLFGIIALYKQLKISFSNIKSSEFYLLGSIILPFIAFSMSKFHLPHYIYVFFPFWMIITAKHMLEIDFKNKYNNILNKFQGFIIILFIGVSFLILGYIFPNSNYINWVCVSVFSFLIIYYLLKENGITQIITTSSLGMLVIGFVLNFQYVPELVKFDSYSQAAKYSKPLHMNKIISNTANSLIFDIYSGNTVSYEDLWKLEKFTNKNNWVFVNEINKKVIDEKYKVKNIYSFKHFGITELTLPFLNPKTREKELTKYYLIEI